MKIAIIAGEASGDLLGAHLIRVLRQKYPHAQIEGIGGEAMITAGFKSLFNIERLNVMGFIEPLKRLMDLWQLRRALIQHFTQHKPDLFIGIDAPDFNLGLEKKLKSRGIPVIHYVSQSVWAWRQYRVHKIAKAVNLMLTLLPFETKFYQHHQIPVRYVGHPLARNIPFNIDKITTRRSLGMEDNLTYIALLPGSRAQEIRYLAEPFLLAAKQILAIKKDVRFLTSSISEARFHEFYDYFQQVAPDLPLHFFTQRTHDVMAAADVVVVASGTATLETMLYKKPMIIAYKMSRLTYFLAKKLVRIPLIGLPNLLAESEIVPELIQDNLTPEAITQHVLNYLEHPEKVENLQRKFMQMHQQLLNGSINKADENLLEAVSVVLSGAMSS